MAIEQIIAAAVSAGTVLGVCATQAVRYLLARGGWAQEDKTKLWERIGALEARDSDRADQLEQVERELHVTQTKLALAEAEIQGLKAGYGRIRAERDLARKERDEARAQVAELEGLLEQALAAACFAPGCPSRQSCVNCEGACRCQKENE